MDFYGYMRPNGKAGARNYVLLLPVNRSLNFIASNVERMTRNTRHFEIPAETGRTEVDREVIARTLIGLMNNANVGGIVLLRLSPARVLPTKTCVRSVLKKKPEKPASHSESFTSPMLAALTTCWAKRFA